MHRGRLIYPITVTIRRLNPAGTATAGDYDDIAGEAILNSTSDGVGENARHDLTDVDIPVQVEERSELFERLGQMIQGNSPMTKTYLTFHINDLKRLGLWIEDAAWGGRPNLAVGDRILGFKDRYNQQLFKVPENPGLYIDAVTPTGFLTTNNLWVITVSDRAKGAV